MFGPMLPQLFFYGFIGMLVLGVIMRIRIAYTVRKFPKYDNSLNKSILLLLSSCVFIYAYTSILIYSNEGVFANKSASDYYSVSDKKFFHFDLDPALPN